MYIAPDFIKVDVKVDEAFTSYCIMGQGTRYLLDGNTYCSQDNIRKTFIELNPNAPYQCFFGDME